jgi:uncharacterized membrane protein HdeD (DUF308 family)
VVDRQRCPGIVIGVAMLFGLVILLWPGLILAVITLLFGVYALVDRVEPTRGALRQRRNAHDRRVRGPHPVVGKVFTILYILVGIGITSAS